MSIGIHYEQLVQNANKKNRQETEYGSQSDFERLCIYEAEIKTSPNNIDLLNEYVEHMTIIKSVLDNIMDLISEQVKGKDLENIICDFKIDINLAEDSTQLSTVIINARKFSDDL